MTASVPLRSRARGALSLALGVVALAAAITGTRGALRGALALRAGSALEADDLYLPGPTALRLLSLGHTEAAADLVAARANVYFGSQVARRGDQRWLARYLTTAVTLDPHFHRLYARGAAMLVYGAPAITVEGLTAANALLARGARQFPSDWELPFQLGFNLFYELPQLVGEDDPRTAEWRQQGVEALRQATLLDGAPPWLPGLAARMLTKRGGEELAVRHLEQSYAATSNPETRAEIARKLGVLHEQRRATELAEGAATLARTLEERYPYAPEAFSLIAGPRLPAGLDLPAVLGRALADGIAGPPPASPAPPPPVAGP